MPQDRAKSRAAQSSALSPLSLLDGPALFAGCSHSYIDMGTNEGRRFDILLVPEKRPRQGIFAFYGKVNRSELCVVGFEPNPAHAPKLSRRIRDEWRPRARVFHIFSAAISANNDVAPFWTDGAKREREWGASLLNYNPGAMRGVSSGRNGSHVRTISLDWFLRKHVIAAGSENRVLAKMDIEAAEYGALPPALDAVCKSIDRIQLELHEKLLFQRSGMITNTTAFPSHLQRAGYAARLRYFRGQNVQVQELKRTLGTIEQQHLQGSCRTQLDMMASR